MSWTTTTHPSTMEATIQILNTGTYHSLTHSLTPCCRVLLEKLTGLQLVEKFPAFHGTRWFITALTSVRHLSLSWANPIQSTYPHPTSWRSILILSTHLCLGLHITVQMYKIVCCICAAVSRDRMIGVVSGIRAGRPLNRSSIPGRCKPSFFSTVSPDRLTQLPADTLPTL